MTVSGGRGSAGCKKENGAAVSAFCHCQSNHCVEAKTQKDLLEVNPFNS